MCEVFYREKRDKKSNMTLKVSISSVEWFFFTRYGTKVGVKWIIGSRKFFYKLKLYQCLMVKFTGLFLQSALNPGHALFNNK